MIPVVVLHLFSKKEIEFAAMKKCPNTESIWCRVNLGVSSCVIAAVYRPPKAALICLESLQDYLLTYVSANARVIIAGDSDLPNVLWEALEVGAIDAEHCEAVLDITLNNDLTQIVQHATRIGTTMESILDLVFISSQ